MSEAAENSVEVAAEKKPAPTSATGSSKPKGMRKNGNYYLSVCYSQDIDILTDVLLIWYR